MKFDKILLFSIIGKNNVVLQHKIANKYMYTFILTS